MTLFALIRANPSNGAPVSPDTRVPSKDGAGSAPAANLRGPGSAPAANAGSQFTSSTQGPRAATVAPTDRSNGEVGPPTHGEVAALGELGGLDPHAAEAPLATAVPVATAVASDLTVGGPAHASVVISNLNGQGLPVRPVRAVAAAAAAVVDPKGYPDGTSSDKTTGGPHRGAGWNEVQTASAEIRPDGAVGELEVPDPQMADLITSFLPFSRSSLDHAIDRFLEPFDDLGAAMPEWQGPMGLVPASLTVAVTVLALDVAIRLRRSRDEEADGDAGLVPFPGLPGLWRWSKP